MLYVANNKCFDLIIFSVCLRTTLFCLGKLSGCLYHTHDHGQTFHHSDFAYFNNRKCPHGLYQQQN